MHPASGTSRESHYPKEWAYIAMGLRAGAGNSECGECRADFDVFEGKATLIEAREDPFGFAARFKNRCLSLDELRWLGIGKLSPHTGLVCQSCHAELDESGAELELVQSENEALRPLIGRAHSLEDWTRIAQDLPTVLQEPAFDADFDSALVEAYEQGKVSVTNRLGKEMDWMSAATRFDLVRDKWKRKGAGQLKVSGGKIIFRGMLSKWEIAVSEVSAVDADGPEMTLETTDGRLTRFQIPATTLVAKLRSGKREVLIAAENLVRRLTHVGTASVPP
jgi:hypothetical protein